MHENESIFDNQNVLRERFCRLMQWEPVTLTEIAKNIGVSRITISNFINKKTELDLKRFYMIANYVLLQEQKKYTNKFHL